MSIHEIGYNISSPEYVQNSEHILAQLAREKHPISVGMLHGKPVYIITDIAVAKLIFEDAKNFSFAPSALKTDQGLTEAAKAFAKQGFESELVSADYEGYRDLRKILNSAFKHSYNERAGEVDSAAKAHLARVLADTRSAALLDVLDLCRRYWLPLIADIIGVSSLSAHEMVLLAKNARALNDGYGMHGDLATIKKLAEYKEKVTALITKVILANAAPTYSALGYFLRELDTEIAIDLSRTFILGSIDSGSGVLPLQTHLLAINPGECKRFLAMSRADQQASMTELASKEAPIQYMPRFAVREVTLLGVTIPAGAQIQLALQAMNGCANPDFDIDRGLPGSCPIHDNETIPFGHARHKCPGETLARHLIPIFLDGFFRRFSVSAIKSFRMDENPFSRHVTEFTVEI